MTTTITNNAESGLATGTAASTANTGSPAGTAFTTVTPGTGGSITFDSTTPLHGSLSYLFSQGSTANFAEWNQTVLPALTDYYLRCTLRPTGIPTGEVPLFQGIGADLATQGWRLSLLSSGKLRLRGGGSSPGTSLQDSTTVLAAGSAYRIAVHVVSGTTTGSIEVRIFANLESTVPSETIGPITGINTGTDLSRLRIGNTVSSPTMPAFRLDDLIVTDTGGWPGPVIVYAAPTAGFTYSVSSLTATFTDTSSPAGGGPTIASWLWNFGDGSTSTSQNPSHVYAASGSYPVTLTVTDNLGRTGVASTTVTLTPPSSTVKWIALDQSSGWAVQGAASVLAAVTDGNAATYVVSLVGPTDQALGGAAAPMTALTPGVPLNVIVQSDKINAASGTLYGKLYQGNTLISTSAAVAVPDADLSGGSPVTSLNKTVTLVFPWSDVQNVTDPTALKFYLYANGS